MRKDLLLLAILAITGNNLLSMENPRQSLNSCMETLGIPINTALDEKKVIKAHKSQLHNLNQVAIPKFVDKLIESLKQADQEDDSNLNASIKFFCNIQEKLKTGVLLTTSENLQLTKAYQDFRTYRIQELSDAYYDIMLWLKRLGKQQ